MRRLKTEEQTHGILSPLHSTFPSPLSPRQPLSLFSSPGSCAQRSSVLLFPVFYHSFFFLSPILLYSFSPLLTHQYCFPPTLKSHVDPFVSHWVQRPHSPQVSGTAVRLCLGLIPRAGPRLHGRAQRSAQALGDANEASQARGLACIAPPRGPLCQSTALPSSSLCLHRALRYLQLLLSMKMRPGLLPFSQSTSASAFARGKPCCSQRQEGRKLCTQSFLHPLSFAFSYFLYFKRQGKTS